MLKSSLLYCTHAGENCLICRYWKHPCPCCKTGGRKAGASGARNRPVRPCRFTCPECRAKLRRPARPGSPCPTCCHPFDYGTALRHLKEQRDSIREVFGVEAFSSILVRLDIDGTLDLLSGETGQLASVEYVSRRFMVFEVVNDSVVFSFDSTPLADLDELRERLQNEC